MLYITSLAFLLLLSTLKRMAFICNRAVASSGVLARLKVRNLYSISISTAIHATPFTPMIYGKNFWCRPLLWSKKFLNHTITPPAEVLYLLYLFCFLLLDGTTLDELMVLLVVMLELDSFLLPPW
mmetsp:Transcript_21895/g.26388  ORF Transcript_21895/g.26388 Transcript_21895/m.26388 type:complete len:125 (-) Transcript_21895:30-404(-)